MRLGADSSRQTATGEWGAAALEHTLARPHLEQQIEQYHLHLEMDWTSQLEVALRNLTMRNPKGPSAAINLRDSRLLDTRNELPVLLKITSLMGLSHKELHSKQQKAAISTNPEKQLGIPDAILLDLISPRNGNSCISMFRSI